MDEHANVDGHAWGGGGIWRRSKPPGLCASRGSVWGKGLAVGLIVEVGVTEEAGTPLGGTGREGHTLQCWGAQRQQHT